MPITVTRDDAAGRFTVVATGSLSASELVDCMATCRADPYRLYQILFDAREASPTLGGGHIRSLADRAGAGSRGGPTGRVAIVAAHMAVYGLARMYEILCGMRGIETLHVVRTIEEAERWLTDGTPS